MGILQVAGILAGLFAILNWLILPQLGRSLARPMPDRPVLLIMSVLLARVLRSICLIGALTFGAIALILGVVLLAGHVLTIHQLEPIYQGLVSVRKALEALDAWWGILTIGVLSVGLWFSVRRDAQKQLQAAFDGAVDEAIAAAQTDAEAGKTISPTPEMAAVSARMTELRGQLEQAIAARSPEHVDSPPDPKTEPELAGMIKQFQELDQELHRLDVVRRLDIGSRVGDVSAPAIESRGRFGRFLASVGLVNSMGYISRALTIASLVLLAPTLVTVSGTLLAEAVEQTDVGIHDLIVADSEAQAERDWQSKLPPPPQPRELTQEDSAVIHQISLHYQHYARAYVAREFHFAAESSAVRRRVLDDFAAARPAGLEVHGGPADARAAVSTPGPEPFGEEARRAQEILESHARNSPEREWGAFREKASAFVRSFGEPLSTGDLGQRLFTEILNTGGSVGLDGGAESSALRSVIAEVGKPGDMVEEAGKLTKIDVLRFAMDIYDHGSPDLAGHPLGDSVALRSSKTERWADRVRGKVALAVNRPGQAPPRAIHESW
jgi:hypothetical protein